MTTYQAIADSTDRDAWLEARKNYVTATELAMLAGSSTDAWQRLKAEKNGTQPRFKGNQWTAWGIEREPVIAQRCKEMFGLEHNTTLFASTIDPRIAATPDLIDPGDALVGDIKTRCLDRGEEARLVEVPQRYYDQLQVQMFVMGVEESVLVVENYRTGPNGVFVTTDWGDQTFTVPFDQERMDYLLSLVGQFESLDDPSPFDLYLNDYLQADERVKAATAERDEIKKLIEKEADGKPLKFVNTIGTITRAPDKTETVKEFDLKRFQDEHPDLWEQYQTEKTKSRKGVLRVTRAKEAA